MFAAAATVAQMFFDLSVQTARWLATRAFTVAIIAIMFPWVLKSFFIWGFKYVETYGREIATYITNQISLLLQSSGSSLDINLELTSVGGYLALQTGLIDYCSIIFTGWGLYWTIAILAKATPRL